MTLPMCSNFSHLHISNSLGSVSIYTPSNLLFIYALIIVILAIVSYEVQRRIRRRARGLRFHR